MLQAISKEGFDIVVIARKGAAGMSYAEAVRELQKLLAKGKLIK